MKWIALFLALFFVVACVGDSGKASWNPVTTVTNMVSSIAIKNIEYWYDSRIDVCYAVIVSNNGYGSVVSITTVPFAKIRDSHIPYQVVK